MVRPSPGRLLVVVLVLTTAVAGCTSAPAQQDTLNRTLDSLTLDEKIGQMLMVGFRGYAVDADTQIAREIAAGRVGGVILFDRDVALGSSERNIRDPAQVRALTAELQGYAEKIPLFIAVDQEGGAVCRLKEAYGYPPTVSAAALGELNNETATREAGRSLAAMVRESGCNLNFAPVVDLNVTADSPAIGRLGRSFSDNASVVAENARWIIEEHHAEGVMTAIKHFPGHGSALADTHAGFTDVTATWTEEELLPYRDLIGRNLPDMVMTAHVYNAHLDPDYPATLSHATVTGILREQLGYDGVVVTDAMDMGAIHDTYGLEESLCLSINAGCDIFLFANNLVYDEEVAEKAVGIVKNLVAEGKISEERINESCARILRLKMRYLADGQGSP
ncbi:glycoside hydrolase family 3 [Methanoculleus taiwanensis]|uniref:beta-N-acetylhexosaminidase n=1 Tax=Methanoculleus taiwanensis TaxID=1550565 RepID=A0A498H339_9EURY|nr:glycoside hydrolase family 3 protein [Methanoculleus taiwanensis]RXE56344.1 glycoside hydrolase family 3 [Methanoculleus taiwanensis]